MSLKLNFLQAIDEVSQMTAKSEPDVKQTSDQKEVDMKDRVDFQGGYEPGVLEPKPLQPETMKTIITKDTQIEGAVVTRGSIDIDGVITGNVTCEKDLTIRGKITGDITAANIMLQSSDVKGNLTVKESAVLQINSAISGNLKAKTVEVNGVVDGDIRASESLKVLSEARITGDISTASLEVAKGAILNGKVSIESQTQNTVKPPVAKEIQSKAAPEVKG